MVVSRMKLGRFLGLTLLLCFTCESLLASSGNQGCKTAGIAKAPPAAASAAMFRGTDPIGPFPLAILAPFPWTDISGIWAGKLPDGRVVYWSLSVVSDCAGRKTLKVLSFDLSTLQATLQGFGLNLPNDQTVRAAVSSSTEQFEVYVRRLMVQRVVKSGRPPVNIGLQTVLTLRPFGSNGNQDVHIVINRQSSQSFEQYVQQIQKKHAH